MMEDVLERARMQQAPGVRLLQAAFHTKSMALYASLGFEVREPIARHTELVRWCLRHGLRIVQPLTLMSLGLYNEPRGSFLPSILF